MDTNMVEEEEFRKPSRIPREAGHYTGPQLVRAYVSRLKRVEAEIKVLNEDKSEIYKEARAMGLDRKVLRFLMRRQFMPRHEVNKFDALLATYERSLEVGPLDS